MFHMKYSEYIQKVYLYLKTIKCKLLILTNCSRIDSKFFSLTLSPIKTLTKRKENEKKKNT